MSRPARKRRARRYHFRRGHDEEPRMRCKLRSLASWLVGSRSTAALALGYALGCATGCGGDGPAGPGSGGLGGAGGGGTPTVLAANEPGAWAIAVDATDVYWTNQDARTVMKVPIAGGTPVMLARGATAAQPWDVAVDSGRVYWNDYASPGSVMTAPLAGGAATTLAGQQDGPRNMAIAGARVYWINLWIFGNNSGRGDERAAVGWRACRAGVGAGRSERHRRRRRQRLLVEPG